VVVSVNWTETLRDRRNSNLCDSETQDTHGSEVGGRKEGIRLINYNLEQNNKRGEVVAQRDSIVKIPHQGRGTPD